MKKMQILPFKYGWTMHFVFTMLRKKTVIAVIRIELFNVLVP